ncbi:unnamed protein product [Aphanomyces euteiches]
MTEHQWQDYRDALRSRDVQASHGRKNQLSARRNESSPTCAPVCPVTIETTIEYAGVWVLKLAYRDGRQRADILSNFHMTRQDVVAFGVGRHRAPRIHHSVVDVLVRRRARHDDGGS